MDAATALRERIRTHEPTARLVKYVLDRRDATGKFPRSITIPCRSDADFETAREVFAHDNVTASDKHSIIVNTGRWRTRFEEQYNVSLEAILYAITQRRPKNHREARASLRAELSANVASLRPRTPLAVALQVQVLSGLSTPSSRWLKLAETDGKDAVANKVATALELLEAIETNETPTRLANFSRKHTRSTKTFAPGSDLYQLVTDALVRLDPVSEAVYAAATSDLPLQRVLALESHGIYRNETTIEVIVHGDLTLTAGHETFDHVSRYARHGRPCAVLLSHLRDATARTTARRILVVENETTFNDAVDLASGFASETLIVASRGQANSAVIRLLQLIAAGNPSATFHHWGDLDPYGVQILHSLRARTRLAIEPFLMSAELYESHLASGSTMPIEHATLLERQRRAGISTCPDLQLALMRSKLIIEQEAIFLAVEPQLRAFL